MAVEDKYVDANLVAGKTLTGAAQAQGAKVVKMVQTFEIAAADDDGSVYRVFKNVPSQLTPISIRILCDAITGGTDFDLGLYKPDLGAVVDKDILMDGQTLATALTLLTAASGLAAVDIANIGKMLWEIAGATISTRPAAYDIALTANTVGTAAGTVTVIAEFLVQ